MFRANATTDPTFRTVEDAILAAQDQRGAFASSVLLRGRRLGDRNGFVTALVVRALGAGPLPHRLHDARELALDYLEQCERVSAPGTFGFWPEAERPTWAPALPADADDTAVMALELQRGGRRSPAWLRRVAVSILLPFRVQEDDDEPAWVRPGVFRTWLDRRLPNPVDCVVNVNVAALLASAGLVHVAAYHAVAAMTDAALEWTGDAPQRVAQIAPFYAHPVELWWALAHAVGCGAREMEPSLRRVRAWFPREIPSDPDRPVCCSAYGAVTWRSAVLQRVRRECIGAGTDGPATAVALGE